MGFKAQSLLMTILKGVTTALVVKDGYAAMNGTQLYNIQLPIELIRNHCNWGKE